MSSIISAAAIACPNCRQPMRAEEFERHDHGTVSVQLCFACAGIWFDPLVSVQLAPAAVIELFKEIYAHRDGSSRPAANTLRCPRCPGTLTLSFDLSKTGRFSYFSCHAGDGRFTPFLQFLREKQFVRSLTAVELQRIRAQVRQITCSECGAPIDLEHDTQCKYCHAPVSFLDPQAVDHAVRMWSDADARGRTAPSPLAVGNALLQSQLQNAPRVFGQSDTRCAPDLVSWGIHAIGRLFEGSG